MKRNFRVFIFAVGILLVLAALAAPGGAFADSSKAGASSGAQSSSVEITIDNFSFTPAIVTVKTGTQITWKNRDDIPHTVVSSDNLFKSKALDTDDTFSFTPSKPGTYLYFCSLHPKMTGKVVVE
ncbi:MAG: cupredoxin family copper-binding protein [Terriglobales bacterium]